MTDHILPGYGTTEPGFYATGPNGERCSRATHLPPGYFGDQQQIIDDEERAHRDYVEHHRDYPQDPLYN